MTALAIDYTAPLFLYWVPGRRRLKSTSWEVETSHFAERFQLFIIIALGEAIVVTGATTAALDLDTARIVALATRIPVLGRALVAVLRLRRLGGRAATRATRPGTAPG